MTITQLHYVLAVAEHQNFTKAAHYCHVTQPTLSMQVQKLEDELNVQIFDRRKKPIELTAVGTKIIAQAKNIVAEAERINDIVDQEKGFIGGEFKLGMIPTIMPTLLPMFLKNFIKNFPMVKLKIEELNTNELISRIHEGHLDAAIAATPLRMNTIKERVLFYEPFVGYISPNHRLKEKTAIEISDLDINDMLLLEDGHCFREGVLNLCKTLKEQQNETFQLESGSIEMLVKLSNEGMGMTLLPYLNTLDLKLMEQKNLRFFTNPPPAREVSLIYNKNELKIQIIEAIHRTISGITRSAIKFQDVQIISPIAKNEPQT
ncbi:MAG: hydrogen peroxide-inducible genes activator [Flavobacteriaceae bacterium]|tara:strand:- start:843 stop:1796 length:954 start_codon:yes stop_codon:yes gene_type:complete